LIRKIPKLFGLPDSVFDVEAAAAAASSSTEASTAAATATATGAAAGAAAAAVDSRTASVWPVGHGTGRIARLAAACDADQVQVEQRVGRAPL